MSLLRILACCALLSAWAIPAAADYPSALVFGTGYATGPAQWTPWQNLPNLEDSLWIYGTVSEVREPFLDLLPPAPYEMTYVFDSYACVFAMHGGDQTCSFSEIAIFDVGSIRVFLDTTPDADLADPATFRDGQQVLVADASPLQLFMEDNCMTGIRYVQRAIMQFRGGAWFARVSKNGEGFVAGDVGEFFGDIPAGIAALGYVGQSTSRIDILTPTRVESTTWGRIKALYRGATR